MIDFLAINNNLIHLGGILTGSVIVIISRLLRIFEV